MICRQIAVPLQCLPCCSQADVLLLGHDTRQQSTPHCVLLLCGCIRLRDWLTPSSSYAANAFVAQVQVFDGTPVVLRYSNRTFDLTDADVSVGDVLQHLVGCQQRWPAAWGRTAQDNGSNSSSRSRLAAAQGSGVADAAGTVSQDSLHAAALQLFGSSTGCIGIPGTCHRVCAVPDAAGGIAGVMYCLEQYTPGAADSFADVLSSMKASLSLNGEAGWNRWGQ
jgi:hypothetical protein